MSDSQEDDDLYNWGEVSIDKVSEANKASLLQIFKSYNIKIDQNNKKVTCPFKHHANGNEKTPSFFYYPQNNSFYCFGCKSGRYPVDFVSIYENIDRLSAADKILNNFDLVESVRGDDEFKEKALLLICFSNFVREQIKTIDRDKLSEYERNLSTFDNYIRNNEDISKKGFQKLIDIVKDKMTKFYLLNIKE